MLDALYALIGICAYIFIGFIVGCFAYFSKTMNELSPVQEDAIRPFCLILFWPVTLTHIIVVYGIVIFHSPLEILDELILNLFHKVKGDDET